MIPSSTPLLSLPPDVIRGAIIPNLAARFQIFSIVSLGISCKRLHADCGGLLEVLKTGPVEKIDDPNLKAFSALEFSLRAIKPYTPPQEALLLILDHARCHGAELPSGIISPALLAEWEAQLRDADQLSASLITAFASCEDKLPGPLRWNLAATLSERGEPDGRCGEVTGRLIYMSNRTDHLAQMLRNDETSIKALVDASSRQTDLAPALPRIDIMALLNDRSSKGNSSNSRSDSSYVSELLRQSSSTSQVEPVLKKKAKRKKKCALM